MADFDVNTITAQGAIAIASATAGDKLVIDGCDATTQVLTKAQAVQIGTRPVSPASTTTSIALAGSTDNHVYAYASFIKGETGQPGGNVHSFFLYGHMESTPNSIVVIAIASATDDIHLPTSSDVTNRTEIQFELTFSATDEVVTVADTSMYTTRGEFLLLKNRTVTTHAEGAATTGEDQSIYGDKNFVDTLSLNDAYKMQATVTTSSGTTTEAMMFTPKSDYGKGPFVISNRERNGSTYRSSLMSVGAGTGLNLGESARFTVSHVASSNKCTASMVASGGFDQSSASAGVDVEKTGVTLYTTTDGSPATKQSMTITGSGIDTGDMVIKGSVFYGYSIECDYLSVNTSRTTPASHISVDSSLVPSGHAVVTNLGDTSHRWDNIYCGNMYSMDSYCDSISPNTNSTVAFMSSVYPFHSGYDLGDLNNPWNKVYAEELDLPNFTLSYDMNEDAAKIDIGLIPKDNGACSLGSTDAEWSAFHCAGTASIYRVDTNYIGRRGGTGKISLYAGIEPATTNIAFGSSGNRFSEIWAGYLNGRLPNARNPIGYLTIGSIAFVCVDYGSASSSQLSFNDEFWKNNGGIAAIYPAMFNPDYPNGGSVFVYDNTDPYLDSYKFIALCNTYGTGRYRFLLAMLNQT